MNTEEKARRYDEALKMYKAIIIALSLNSATSYLRSWGITLEDADSWLKSLRHQYHGDVTMTEAYKMGLEAGKASSWKPSEEQMKALEHFIRSWGESGTMSPQNTILCAAQSLLRDLKKLM